MLVSLDKAKKMSVGTLRKKIKASTDLANNYRKRGSGEKNDYVRAAMSEVETYKKALASKDKTEARAGEEGYNSMGNKNHPAPITKKAK